MKRIAALLVSLSLLSGLFGCGQTDAPEQTRTPEPARPTQSAPVESDCVGMPESAGAYPMTVTDQAGRTVTIQNQPERLVSGYYISTSLLIALGQADKLVGVEAKADSRAIYRLSAPGLIDLPSVGSAKEFDLEGCAALEPDLVILPLKLREAASTLEELGIPVLLVNPESQTLLEGAIDLIAQVTGSRDKALSLSYFTTAQEEWLEEMLAGVQRPSVYLAGNSHLLSTAGGKMYQSGMIRMAGGENVAQDIEDAYWVQVGYEQLLAWDPEYIILASGAGYTCSDVLNDPNLSGCAAVVNGNVYQMPDKAEAWDSPVPGGFLGSVWLAGLLHPDVCDPVNCEQIIEEFYGNFYGFSYKQS